MANLDVFTVRDLRQRTGELIRHAEQGKISVITTHGRPTILALPFDGQLLELGLHRALAIRLLEDQLVTLAQAAKIAGASIADFMGLLREGGVVAVDYPAEELDKEMEIPL